MTVSTEFSLEYDTVNENCGGIPVIIVAGGNSTRMNGIDKISADILGIPVIARTLLAFQRNSNISEIYVVIKEDKISYVKNLCNSFMISKIKGVTGGGVDRCSSVINGLKMIDESNKFVLIHDGARPFVNDNIISAVANADEKYNCVICGVKCNDTIKQVSNGKVVKTLKRDALINVQTPQRLNLKVYKNCIENISDFSLITDDASIMELFGHEILVVNGDTKNIKITSPIDLEIGKAIIKES